MYSGSSLRDPQHGGLNESLHTGRTRHFFFKCAVGPGLHTDKSDVRSLAFVEEYWRLPLQSADPLCSEFGCVRLYSTIPKIYYVIDTWRILGPAPIIRNPVDPTIPHGKLPKSQAQHKREYSRRKRIQRTGVTVALNGS